jgi:peptide deformylase
MNDMRKPVLRKIAQLGHPVLRGSAERIVYPLGHSIQTLVDEMMATMIDADGVGIAAPQLFEPVAAIIVASRPNPRYPNAPELVPMVMINPELAWVSDEMEKGWEGCLSIPGLQGLVPRHQRVIVRYQRLSGEFREEEYSGFLARVIQHEFDHLQGKLFIDRLESSLDLFSEKEYLRR